MRYEDEPLGCFQKVSYGLVGLGLYLACSVLTFGTLFALAFSSPVFTVTFMFGLPGVFVLSFLIAGPLIVGAYMLYLQEIRVIEVKDRPPSITTTQTKDKRKNDSVITE